MSTEFREGFTLFYSVGRSQNCAVSHWVLRSGSCGTFWISRSFADIGTGLSPNSAPQSEYNPLSAGGTALHGEKPTPPAILPCPLLGRGRIARAVCRNLREFRMSKSEWRSEE